MTAYMFRYPKSRETRNIVQCQQSACTEFIEFSSRSPSWIASSEQEAMKTERERRCMQDDPKIMRSQEFVFLLLGGANHVNLQKNLIKTQMFNGNLGTIGGPGPCQPPCLRPCKCCVRINRKCWCCNQPIGDVHIAHRMSPKCSAITGEWRLTTYTYFEIKIF